MCGLAFHKPCMAAVVARHRLLRDEAKEQGELSSDVVAADKKCMKDKASS